jgi:hypothetical protein
MTFDVALLKTELIRLSSNHLPIMQTDSEKLMQGENEFRAWKALHKLKNKICTHTPEMVKMKYLNLLRGQMLYKRRKERAIIMRKEEWIELTGGKQVLTRSVLKQMFASSKDIEIRL